MILVLCDEADPSARWAASALRRRGLSPVVLTGDDLASVERWRHRVSTAGVDCELRLRGGLCLHSREIQGTLNRLVSVPQAWMRRFGGPDRDYAIQEMQALYLSWLYALPGPKLNPPTPQGLCGNVRHPSSWVALAARAGLPVRPFRQTSRDDPASLWQSAPSSAMVHVVNERVIGPDEVLFAHRRGCAQLAKEAAAPLLGVHFEQSAEGDWRMTGASIMPDLAGGGDDLADAIAAALVLS